MTETKDKNKLGIWMTTSLVIGNMIGAGIFLMPSALARYGGISILGWLLSSAGALLLAKVFSKLSNMVKNSNGGPYAFAKVGFGDYVGFLVAWGYWISAWVANAAIAIAFVSALSVFIPGAQRQPVNSRFHRLGRYLVAYLGQFKGGSQFGKNAIGHHPFKNSAHLGDHHWRFLLF